MRIACWILESTDKHSEYATLTAFPQQVRHTKETHCYVYRNVVGLVDF